MNVRYLLIGIIVATLVVIAFDSLWFLMIMPNLADTPVEQGEGGERYVWLHILGEFLFAMIVTILYPRFTRKDDSVSTGAGFGFWMGLLAMAPAAIHMSAEIEGMYPLYLAIASVLAGILAGIAVSIVYKATNKTAAAPAA